MTGCASKTVVQTEFIYPPEASLQSCVRPVFGGDTFGELVIYTKKLQSEFDICASRIESIKDWRNKTQERKND